MDNSKYADSAQARQLDRDLDARARPASTGQRFPFEPNPVEIQARRDREARNKAARSESLKGALAQMDAFFGSQPVKRNADGIIVSR